MPPTVLTSQIENILHFRAVLDGRNKPSQIKFNLKFDRIWHFNLNRKI